MPSWPYIVGAVVGLIITALLIAGTMWPVINEVETGETPEYPDVQPQYYSASPEKVFREVRAGIDEMSRWDVADARLDELTLEATHTTLLFRFVDDVTVWVESVTDNVTRVDVRSASRVGKGDFGQNARNINDLFDELDSRLGSDKVSREELETTDQQKADQAN
jgi:uncharacterized protein (DUF1499 family)